MNHAILEHKLIVPAHLVPFNALESFKVTLRNEEDEPVEYAFYHIDHSSGLHYFDRGDLNTIYRVFGHLKIEDRRSAPIMESSMVRTDFGLGLTFTGSLRENQTHVVDLLCSEQASYGQLKAHPRFGKTVVMVAVACRLKLKALFLSHEIGLANQAYERFVQMTNLTDLEYELGKQVVGVVEEWDDLQKYDVAIMSYQKFVSGKNASEMLRKYRNQFGLIFVDESHKARAETYSHVISSFNSKFRYGVSGTTELKGDFHLLNQHILGPVIVEGHGDQLPCTVITYNTNVAVPLRPSKLFFTMATTYLSKHDARNQMILSVMKQYLEAGHTIVAVSDRAQHCDWLADQIKKMGFTAESYHAKKYKKKEHREETLNRVRSGATQAMIAMRNMVLGLDLPRALTFFNTLPTAHPQNYFQELSRVRTPFTDPTTGFVKTMGTIIDFRDNHHILKACYKTRRRVYLENQFIIYDDLSDEVKR